MCSVSGHADILSEYCLIPSITALAMELLLLQNCTELMTLLLVLSSHVRLLHVHLWRISTPLVFELWDI